MVLQHPLDPVLPRSPVGLVFKHPTSHLAPSTAHSLRDFLQGVPDPVLPTSVVDK